MSASRRPSVHMSRVAGRPALEKLKLAFINGCESRGLEVPKQVLSEFKKRISKCGTPDDKAKLNLSNCSLNDEHISFLVEALAAEPIIAKLDLRANNLTNKSIRLLLRLLKCQVRLIRSVDVDSRLSAAFMGELQISSNISTLEDALLNDIQTLAAAVKHCNAVAHIRSVYKESGSPELIYSAFLTSMWQRVVGKTDKQAIVRALASGKTQGRESVLVFEEMESALLAALVSTGALSALSEWQQNKISALAVDTLGVGSEVDSRAPPEDHSVLTDEHRYSELWEGDSVATSREGGRGGGRGGGGDQHSVNGDSVASYDHRHVQPIKSFDKGKTISAITNTNTSAPAANSSSNRRESSPLRQSSPSSQLQSAGPGTGSLITSANLGLLRTPNSAVNSEITHSGNSRQSSSAARARRESSPTNSPPEEAEPSRRSFSSSGRKQLAERMSDIQLSTPPADDSDRRRSLEPVVAYRTSSSRDSPPPRRHTSASAVSSSRRSQSAPRQRESLAATSPNNHGSSPSSRHSSPAARSPGSRSSSRNSSPNRATFRGTPTTGGSDGQRRSRAQTPESPQSKFAPEFSTIINKEVLAAEASSNTWVDLTKTKLTAVTVKHLTLYGMDCTDTITAMILRNNRISDLTSVLLPTNLTSLDIAGNKLSVTIPLACMPKSLKTLDISYNNLTDLSPLSRCTELETLCVAHNLVKNFPGLIGKLRYVDLSHNLIGGLINIRMLSLCSSLSHLLLAGNPIENNVPNYRVQLRSVLQTLTDLDGVVLPRHQHKLRHDKKKLADESSAATAVKPQQPFSRKQQKMTDLYRTQHHFSKMQALEESRIINERMFYTPSIGPARLGKDEVEKLCDRLYATKTGFISDTHNQSNVSRNGNMTLNQSFRGTAPTSVSQSLASISGLPATAHTHPASHHRPHPSRYRNVDDDNNKDLVNNWLSDCSDELSRAVAVLNSIFNFANKNHIEMEMIKIFSLGLGRISFYPKIQLPPSVDTAITKTSQHGRDPNLMALVSNMFEQMVSFATLLKEIEHATNRLEHDDNISDFKSTLDVLMNTVAGQYVNYNILAPHNCEYRPKSMSSTASLTSLAHSESSFGGIRSGNTIARQHSLDRGGMVTAYHDNNEDDVSLNQFVEKFESNYASAESNFQNYTKRQPNNSFTSTISNNNNNHQSLLSEDEVASRMSLMKQRLTARAMQGDLRVGSTVATSQPLLPSAATATAASVTDDYDDLDDAALDYDNQSLDFMPDFVPPPPIIVVPPVHVSSTTTASATAPAKSLAQSFRDKFSAKTFKTSASKLVSETRGNDNDVDVEQQASPDEAFVEAAPLNDEVPLYSHEDTLAHATVPVFADDDERDTRADREEVITAVHSNQAHQQDDDENFAPVNVDTQDHLDAEEGDIPVIHDCQDLPSHSSHQSSVGLRGDEENDREFERELDHQAAAAAADSAHVTVSAATSQAPQASAESRAATVSPPVEASEGVAMSAKDRLKARMAKNKKKEGD